MRRGYRYLLLSLVALGALLFAVASTSASQTGNGGPSGAHYNLNVIGVPKDKTVPSMTDTSRHTMFVRLGSSGNVAGCKILLGNSDVLDDGGYYVKDGNCTDDGEAEFWLPNPDPNNSGETLYSVFARGLGTPGGQATVTSCFDSTTYGTECSDVGASILRVDAGRSQFSNVSKELLYIYTDIDEDLDLDRVPLFSGLAQDFWWQYDNQGLKLAQLRFYECSSTVDDPTTVVVEPTTDDCGRTGNGS